MDMADRDYLREFFRALGETPLEPNDPRYVRLYDDERLAPDDPVGLLARNIDFTPGESVQLFSGFRGTGKSTELRRLRAELRGAGYAVLLVDMAHYLNLSSRVDVSDFLMAVAGAVGEQVVDEKLVTAEDVAVSYWDRFVGFLKRTKIDGAELGVEFGLPGAAKVNVKANLRSDPDFVRRLQAKMATHLGAFVEDVREYFGTVAQQVTFVNPKYDGRFVVLVDSVERIRGASANAEEVQASVETLFASHADKLRIPGVHVVYTVPPYLKVRYAGLGAEYGLGGVQILPTLKVRSLADGRPFQPGLDALERVVSERGDWKRLLGSRAVLDELSLTSGGHLRDLLRLIADLILRARSLPLDEAVIDRAIEQLRQEFLPIPAEDARWLARVSQTKSAELRSMAELPDLARFLDTHLILCYRNGSEWYDVHPLVRDVVRREATEPPVGPTTQDGLT